MTPRTWAGRRPRFTGPQYSGIKGAINEEGKAFQRSWGFSVDAGSGNDYISYRGNLGSSGDRSSVHELTSLPGQGEQTDCRPAVGCLVPAGFRPHTYRLIIDGRDVTSATSLKGNRVAYEPTYDLEPGRHQARFTGFAHSQSLE